MRFRMCIGAQSTSNHVWKWIELNPLQSAVHKSFNTVDGMVIAHTVWVTKKFLFFETRYRATVILRSVFVSVPFHNCPCFYCCVSILKVCSKERLKNNKKNSAKTV